MRSIVKGTPFTTGGRNGQDDRSSELSGSWSRRIFVVGSLALGLQFLWLALFSTLQYERGDLTWDFSVFNQARFLLTKNIWSPFDTVTGFPYWQNHGEFLMWPLAQITRLPPGGLWLLWFQAAAVAGCGLVALSWTVDLTIAHRRGAEQRQIAPWIIALVSVLLIANPWSYYAAAFDFHFQALGALGALLACRELFGPRRRRLWVWVIFTLATGDVSATYIAAAGVAGLLGANKSSRRASIFLIGSGLGWVAVLTILDANKASSLVAGYGYLASASAPGTPISIGNILSGAILHPTRALYEIWLANKNIWANISPAGLLGVADPVGIGSVLLVLIPNVLNGANANFGVPGFQSLPLYPFVAVGTARILMRAEFIWLRWGSIVPRQLSRMVCIFVGVLSIVWGAVWLPTYPSRWLTVTPSGSHALAIARKLIPHSAEVIASQGILGRFSGRASVYGIFTGGTFPVNEAEVFFVISPSQGIEDPVQASESALAQVATTIDSTLVEHRSGIWVFRWIPPDGTRAITLQPPQGLVSAWTLRVADGGPVLTGPSSDWRMVGNGARGYVVYGDYWFEKPGTYIATSRLVSTGPVNVEVWNSSTNTLLAQRHVAEALTPRTVTVPFNQTVRGSEPVFAGTGPFLVEPVPPPDGQPIEIRVYNPGGSLVSVYSVGVSSSRHT